MTLTNLAGRTVFSGIQPTGTWHIGNYLGAVQNWVALQQRAQDAVGMLFCVVDLHALTVPKAAPGALQQQRRRAAASMLACGLDPERVTLFTQSHVPAHAELAWLLACHTPVGSLFRMTQFKTKGASQSAANAGLLTYPILMAADVLLYRASVVPVGQDQLQHLELARDLARAYNRYVGRDAFPDPEPLVTSQAKILSLRDGSSKMSKSADSAASRIDLDDAPDVIRRKLARAKTDMVLPFPTYDPDTRPEVSNLLTIFAAVTQREPGDVAREYQGSASMGKFKADLTDAVIQAITPVGREIDRLCADPAYLDRVLLQGAQEASALAHATMQLVRQDLGLCELAVPCPSSFA